LADDECTGLAEELALQVKKKQRSTSLTIPGVRGELSLN